MKIGVLSDTHGDVPAVEKAIGILQDFGVALTIHCGDIGPEILPLLENMQTHFVDGNMDNLDELSEATTNPRHQFHKHLGTLEIEGRRVAFLHGHDITLLRHTIHSGYYDLVCHGHTHAFSSGYEGKTLVLNPGALARTTRPSVAIVDLTSLGVTEIAV